MKDNEIDCKILCALEQNTLHFTELVYIFGGTREVASSINKSLRRLVKRKLVHKVFIPTPGGLLPGVYDGNGLPVITSPGCMLAYKAACQ